MFSPVNNVIYAAFFDHLKGQFPSRLHVLCVLTKFCNFKNIGYFSC